MYTYTFFYKVNCSNDTVNPQNLVLDGSSAQTDEPFNALPLGKLRYRDFDLDYFTSSLPCPMSCFEEISYTVKANRLSQALDCFYRESKSFFYPVSYFFPRYEVVNSEGKSSVRFIPSKYMLTCPYRGGLK